MSQKKKYKDSAVGSSSVISQVLILHLNPIPKNEECSKPEMCDLRAEKRDKTVEKPNQQKRSKIRKK